MSQTKLLCRRPASCQWVASEQIPAGCHWVRCLSSSSLASSSLAPRALRGILRLRVTAGSANLLPAASPPPPPRSFLPPPIPSRPGHIPPTSPPSSPRPHAGASGPVLPPPSGVPTLPTPASLPVERMSTVPHGVPKKQTWRRSFRGRVLEGRQGAGLARGRVGLRAATPGPLEASSTGSSGAGIAFQSCPKLRQGV